MGGDGINIIGTPKPIDKVADIRMWLAGASFMDMLQRLRGQFPQGYLPDASKPAAPCPAPAALCPVRLPSARRPCAC